MATPNERDKEVANKSAIALIDSDRPAMYAIIANYREEIEARATEQGGEMRAEIERLKEEK